MVHFHQRIRTRIRIPNPIVTLYYAQLFPLVRIWIPVRIVSQLVTVPRSVPIPYICIRGSESKSEPVEKTCIVQESESVSASGNKPLSMCTTIVQCSLEKYRWISDFASLKIKNSLSLSLSVTTLLMFALYF